MGVNFLGLNIPTSAAEAGNNLHDNAIAQAQALAARGREAAAIPANIGGGLQDFFHGLVTGHALGQSSAQAPQTTTKAQAKDMPIGGKFVELPGVGRVQMPSEAWLRAHPADAGLDTGTAAAPAKAAASGGGSAKVTNPFDEMAARYAQANGGTMSLGEMASLADIAAKTSMLRTQPKAMSAKDVAGLELKNMSDQLFTGKMAQSQALKAQDPAGAAKLQDDAVKERADYLKSILGANPVDLQTADAIGGNGTQP